MRARPSLIVMLASALTFLASLYLPWLVTAHQTAVIGFPGFSYDGWRAYGQGAALAALALVAEVAVALLRPELTRRLPLVGCGFALLFFALADAVEIRGNGRFQGGFEHVSVHVAAGTYVALASAAVALVAAVATRWNELVRRPSATAIAALAFTLGLLAAFLLPWLHVHVPHTARGRVPGPTGYQLSNLGDTLVIFIAAIACFSLPLWTRRTPPGTRLVAASGIAVLTGGYLSPLGTHLHWPYEAWLALGCALGLVALALVTARGLRISLPPPGASGAVVGASLLLVSLFLPWQKSCSLPGACLSSNGWSVGASSSGGLAAILIVALLAFRRLFVELAVGTALYVMATGFDITAYSGGFAYGAPLGFAGATMLLLATAPKLRPVQVEKRRLVRVVPIAACLAFLAIPVARLTGRLPFRLEIETPWLLFWFGLAAILVALRLLGRWLSGAHGDAQLVLLPFALLALTTLALIAARREGTSWEGWASVGLCVFLAVVGWIERNGDLAARLRPPEEIWRVDRLPEAES